MKQAFLDIRKNLKEKNLKTEALKSRHFFISELPGVLYKTSKTWFYKLPTAIFPIFLSEKKLKLAKLASKQRYQIELMRINGY